MVCEQHPDPFDCPDHLVSFAAEFGEYKLIVHDGGSSGSVIKFCPWCGTRLPESRRDEWFDRLEAMGIDPWVDQVPAPFQDGTWMSD